MVVRPVGQQFKEYQLTKASELVMLRSSAQGASHPLPIILIDTLSIVHHQPCYIVKRKQQENLTTSFQPLFPLPYHPFKLSSALRSFKQPKFLPTSTFSSSCGGTTSTSCCLVILLDGVPKRQLYHRVLNCTSVVIPGRLSSLKYYTPRNVGILELRVKIEHTVTPRARELRC